MTGPGCKMTAMRFIFCTVCVLGLLLTACHRKQNYTRIVYTMPAPGPASTVAAGSQPPQSGGTLVIEEPPPEPQPETPEVTEPDQAEDNAKPVPRRRRPTPRVETPAQPEEIPPAEAPEVPALEPRTNASRQAVLQREIESNQQAIGKRLDRLDGLALASADRKLLDDARNFLLQSTSALKEGDLERSRLLAHKAELLVAALEQEY